MRFIGIVNAIIIAVDGASDSNKIKGSLSSSKGQESIVGISIFTTSLRSGVNICKTPSSKPFTTLATDLL